MEPEQRPSGYVLIVEDNADVRAMLTDLLQREGYRVSCATNGQEALDLLRSTPRPCLILLDLTMPVMNGWEFRRRQKQDPALAPVPVVIVSAEGDPARDAGALEAAAYFPKPFNRRELLATVAAHCQ